MLSNTRVKHEHVKAPRPVIYITHLTYLTSRNEGGGGSFLTSGNGGGEFDILGDANVKVCLTYNLGDHQRSNSCTNYISILERPNIIFLVKIPTPGFLALPPPFHSLAKHYRYTSTSRHLLMRC